MKVLIALASVLALCAGQLNNLTHTQELDPAGNFRLSWEVIVGTGDIVLEIQAKAAGWVSLEIVTDDGKYADVIFGGYNDEFSFGYLEVNYILHYKKLILHLISIFERGKI